MERLMQLNLLSAMRLSQLSIKSMLKNNSGTGHIIFISSVAGLDGNVGQSLYSATKAGLIGLTKSLAKEVGSRGIRVNCIAPGFIETDMTRGATVLDHV
jgi:3-oxoacyl-[acyl-carrier protein] reductase